MATESDVISATLLGGATALTVFANMLPPVALVRRNSDPETTRDVRIGVAAAGVITIAFGVIATKMTNSGLPVFVSVVAAGSLAALYEGILQIPPTPTAQKVMP